MQQSKSYRLWYQIKVMLGWLWSQMQVMSCWLWKNLLKPCLTLCAILPLIYLLICGLPKPNDANAHSREVDLASLEQIRDELESVQQISETAKEHAA